MKIWGMGPLTGPKNSPAECLVFCLGDENVLNNNFRGGHIWKYIGIFDSNWIWISCIKKMFIVDTDDATTQTDFQYRCIVATDDPK